ncbi:MAG: Mov34/MPN/PAD-1 family protein [Myxococcota bacterium]|nr:Mov34/MPN/PAD-1 family protein [Myxococcota bacterium]MDW8361143.1 Mov34/MPN/PAD-1 family protein [Myxococcales bacterium]
MNGDVSYNFPWVRGELELSRAALEAIEAHARRDYPSECCGLVTGPADDPPLADHVMEERNLADRYHALDPERFPRTSRTYFKMDELRAARAFEQGRRTGRPVKLIYHSHVDAGAYFSAEDGATFAVGGVLQWPCAFLVVSVRDGEVADRKLWVHVPGTDRFEERPVRVRAP